MVAFYAVVIKISQKVWNTTGRVWFSIFASSFHYEAQQPAVKVICSGLLQQIWSAFLAAALSMLISPLLKCIHSPRCGFLGNWWNVTPANQSILLGNTGEANCGVVFFAGGSSKSLWSISTLGGLQQPLGYTSMFTSSTGQHTSCKCGRDPSCCSSYK